MQNIINTNSENIEDVPDSVNDMEGKLSYIICTDHYTVCALYGIFYTYITRANKKI